MDDQSERFSLSAETVDLFIDCNRRGITLRLERGKVRWSAPEGEVSLEDARNIRSREAEIAPYLVESNSSAVRATTPPSHQN